MTTTRERDRSHADGWMGLGLGLGTACCRFFSFGVVGLAWLWSLRITHATTASCVSRLLPSNICHENRFGALTVRCLQGGTASVITGYAMLDTCHRRSVKHTAGPSQRFLRTFSRLHSGQPREHGARAFPGGSGGYARHQMVPRDFAVTIRIGG